MTIRTSPWPAGVPNFFDLSTTDVPAAAALYSTLFGWQLEDQGPDFGNYQLATRGGHRAGGLGPVMGGAAPAWLLYIASDDIEATAQAIAQHGGTVVAGPFDIGQAGRLCVATDPGGAAFGVWQHGTTIGAELTNEPGGLSWEDNWTDDPEAAAAFYTAVFGWVYEKLDMPGMDYWTFRNADERPPMGGTGRVEPGTAPHWQVYVQVESVDDGVSLVKQHGGSVLIGPDDSPFGRMALVSDAQGATLMLTTPVPGAPVPDRAG